MPYLTEEEYKELEADASDGKALRAENAKLRELLFPLAAAATVFDEINHTSDTDGLWTGNLRSGERVKITLGNARAARRALESHE